MRRVSLLAFIGLYVLAAVVTTAAEVTPIAHQSIDPAEKRGKAQA